MTVCRGFYMLVSSDALVHIADCNPIKSWFGPSQYMLHNHIVLDALHLREPNHDKPTLPGHGSHLVKSCFGLMFVSPECYPLIGTCSIFLNFATPFCATHRP